ncbi:hypothetical protein PUN28_016274 [Cardiocondyla obscurior]|uniref:Uncharacterized protein n=1 Tax=Cardiocondyla obscurior TaxID=286306 RepID=A0AAW2EW17_9HYME
MKCAKNVSYRGPSRSSRSTSFRYENGTSEDSVEVSNAMDIESANLYNERSFFSRLLILIVENRRDDPPSFFRSREGGKITYLNLTESYESK